MRRLIERTIEGPVADMIIDGKLQEGATVSVDTDELGIKLDIR